jgi:hypothetical protein
MLAVLFLLVRGERVRLGGNTLAFIRETEAAGNDQQLARSGDGC